MIQTNKAILLRTLVVNGGHRIQQGCEADVLRLTDREAAITADGCSLIIPRRFVLVVPPERRNRRVQNKGAKNRLFIQRSKIN